MPDQDGYPTEEELKTIRDWVWDGEWDSFTRLLDYVESIWWCSDWGVCREGNRWELHTGGWSGNESIIEALQDNSWFWYFCWQSSRRGGHFTFHIG